MLTKLLNSTVRVTKYTAQHLFRNPFQTLLVSLIISITLLFAQFFFLISIASDQVLNYLENQPQVLVFFQDSTTTEQIMQIKTELEKNDSIESVTYISKEQAVEIYRDRHQDEPELLEFVTPDILPASIEISGNDISYLSTIASQFQQNQFVEKVIFQRDLVDEIVSLTAAIRLGGLIVVGILGFIMVMIIMIIVANNVSSFDREIEIMKLVGAGKSFVMWPFLLDGILYALFATIISTTSVYFIVDHLHNFIRNFIAPISELVLPTQLHLVSNLISLNIKDSLVIDLGVWTFFVAAVFTAFVSLLVVSRNRKL